MSNKFGKTKSQTTNTSVSWRQKLLNLQDLGFLLWGSERSSISAIRVFLSPPLQSLRFTKCDWRWRWFDEGFEIEVDGKSDGSLKSLLQWAFATIVTFSPIFPVPPAQALLIPDNEIWNVLVKCLEIKGNCHFVGRNVMKSAEKVHRKLSIWLIQFQKKILYFPPCGRFWQNRGVWPERKYFLNAGILWVD